MGWRRGSGGCFLSRRTRNYRATRLKPVRGKAFPGSSEHRQAAEPRRGAGGSAVRPEPWPLPRFSAALALHNPAPQLDPSPAESGTQRGILDGGTLVPGPLPGSGVWQDEGRSSDFFFLS